MSRAEDDCMRAGRFMSAFFGAAVAVMASQGVSEKVRYERLMDRAGYVLEHAGGDPGKCEEAMLLYHDALNARPRSAEAKAGERKAGECARRKGSQGARPTQPR
jgi:hypothetical protein